MEKRQLTEFLGPAPLKAISEIHVFSQIDSTNAQAARLVENGLQGAQLIVADCQSAGRGRRGRSWFSPSASGLYLSLVYPFSITTDALQGLSLVTALSIRSAIQNLANENLQLKWPNDLLVGNKKLSGVLLELCNDDKRTWVIFGIGVNYKLSEEQKLAIDRPVIDIQGILTETPSIEWLAGNIVNCLLENIDIFTNSGFATFRTIWNRYDRYYGKDIVVQNGTSARPGRSLGVDESGSLLLLTSEGVQKISGGEIFPSLREKSEVSKQ